MPRISHRLAVPVPAAACHYLWRLPNGANSSQHIDLAWHRRFLTREAARTYLAELYHWGRYRNVTNALTDGQEKTLPRRSIGASMMEQSMRGSLMLITSLWVLSFE